VVLRSSSSIRVAYAKVVDSRRLPCLVGSDDTILFFLLLFLSWFLTRRLNSLIIVLSLLMSPKIVVLFLFLMSCSLIYIDLLLFFLVYA
jgi:hypothetical protein